MECQHCGSQFESQSEFDAHCDWHSERQRILGRHDGRLHGRRFQGKNKKVLQQVSVQPTTPHEAVSRLEQVRLRYSPNNNVRTGKLLAGSHPFLKVDDVLQKFSPYGAEGHSLDLEWICEDCGATFLSSKERNAHYLSRYCLDAAASVFLFFVDRSVPQGYRIEKRSIPFDSQTSGFQCSKCDAVFLGIEQKMYHEFSHPFHSLDCIHCTKTLCSEYELESHYDWHDDVELRRRRDQERNSKLSTGNHSNDSNSDSSLSSVTIPPGSPLDLLDVKSVPFPSGTSSTGLEDGEVVAIGLVSEEDLERLLAPKGTYLGNRNGDNYLQIPETVTREEFAKAASQHDGCALGVWGDITKEGSIWAVRGKTITLEPRSQSSNGGHSSPYSKNESKSKILQQETAFQMDSKTSSVRVKELQREKSGWSPPLSLDQRTPSPFRGKRGSTVRNVLRRANTLDGTPKYAAPSRKFFSNLFRTNSLKMEEVSLKLGTEAPRNAPERPTYWRLHGYGIKGAILVQDVFARKRLVSAASFAEILQRVINDTSTKSVKETITAMAKRARESFKRSDLEDAFHCWEEVIGIVDATPSLDPDFALTLTFLRETAQVCEELGLVNEAESCYLKALTVNQKLHGMNHAENYLYINHLAQLYGKTKRWKEATKLYQRALAGRIKLLGLEHSDTLTSAYELGTASVHLGDYSIAGQLYQMILPGFEQKYGFKSQQTLDILNNLLATYSKLDRREDAKGLALKTISKARDVYGLDHVVTCTFVTAYLRNIDNFEFEADFQELLHRIGENKASPIAFDVFKTLGEAFLHHGLVQHAFTAFDRAIQYPETQQQPAYSPDMLCVMAKLDECCQRLDMNERALQLNMEMQKMHKRTPGRHPNVGEQVTQARLKEIQKREDTLAAERKEWGVSVLGRCRASPGDCNVMTPNRCSVCQIPHLCPSHISHPHENRFPCIPSLTPRTSPSLAVTASVPGNIISRALEATPHPVSSNVDPMPQRRCLSASTFTLLNPENFITFRRKLRSDVNSTIMFNRRAAFFNDGGGGNSSSSNSSERVEPEINIIYTIVDPNQPCQWHDLRITPDIRGDSGSESQNNDRGDIASMTVAWRLMKDQTDSRRRSTLVGREEGEDERYLLVRPREEMFRNLRERRMKLLGNTAGKKGRKEEEEKELVEWCRGLSADSDPRKKVEEKERGKESEKKGVEFMWIVEWE